MFRHDRSLHVSPSDPHWNRAGHELFARFAFGTIADMKLLPSLELGPAEELETWARGERMKELAELEAGVSPTYWGAQRPVEAAIDTGAWTRTTAEQVYTGIAHRLAGVVTHLTAD